MSNSIFVQSDDKFDVIVYYEIVGKKVTLHDIPPKDCQSLKVTFAYPDYATAQRILQLSTKMPSDGGPPVMDFLQMENALLYTLIREWDAKDEKGAPIDVTNENVSKLRVEIARSLTSRVLREIGPLV